MAPRAVVVAILLALGGLVPAASAQTPASTATTATTSSDPGRYAEGSRVCFGSGGICAASNDLFDECQNEQAAHGRDGYWGCICTSGYAAVDEACVNCKVFYGMGSKMLLNYTSSCSSMGYTLAPIPSSILAQQSSRNASLATALPTPETPSYLVTIQVTPTAPLPTVATTFSLPLATGAAPESSVRIWSLAVSLGVGVVSGLW